ncbi:MAG: tetratricopeptide repeat protein [Promicromonosporaceae bacterium]|nr:tetratricopeptide repeat protein [Promicromonosporaceae bacterium]
MRGAVDLTALTRPQAPPPGEPGGAPEADGFVVDITEESFAQVVQDSATYPVIALLWIPTDQANADLAILLGKLAQEAAGRFLLARIDVGTYPQIAGAFGVEGVPTVIALLGGQPLPLFAGVAAEEQVRGVLAQVISAAEANGITGRVPSSDGEKADNVAPPASEETLPPLHQEAFNAIERGDYPAAIAAYEQALRHDPKDAEAQAGLAQVRLLSRTQNIDPATAQAAFVADPADVPAALLAADLELLDGGVAGPFDRLLAVLPTADAEAKEQVRLRLLEYFEILGPTNPQVGKARQRLALFLY